MTLELLHASLATLVTCTTTHLVRMLMKFANIQMLIILENIIMKRLELC